MPLLHAHARNTGSLCLPARIKPPSLFTFTFTVTSYFASKFGMFVRAGGVCAGRVATCGFVDGSFYNTVLMHGPCA